MSYGEKTAISTLVLMALVYGWYFAQILALSGTGTPELGDIGGLLFGAIILFVILMIVSQIAIVIVGRSRGEQVPDAQDERDKIIHAKSGFHSAHLLYAGIVTTMVLAVMGYSPFVLVHSLIATIAITDTVKSILMILSYRRGY